MNELVVLEHISELCSTNQSAADLCRALVHSSTVGIDAVGAAVFLSTMTGEIEIVGSYGRTPHLGDDRSIWADNPIALAIRDSVTATGVMPNGTGEQFPIGAMPILKGQNPIGVVAMMRTNHEGQLCAKLSALAARSVGNTFGLWIDTLGVTPNTRPIDVQASGELTDRQLEILRHIANGRTNAQIASELILSESSIRQETVRIYRSLGVGTRAEAARKGLNLGLIGKIAI
jgi:DNA-binding CsgD family transcriptional regulator